MWVKHNQVEIFIDIEGIPEYDFFYLIGVLVKSNEIYEYHYFWADNENEEEKIWKCFFEFIQNFPTVSIYHYGSYVFVPDLSGLRKLKGGNVK
jgi:predicted RecB family nuclease